jgi:amino acid adenylation domain-containing protein
LTLIFNWRIFFLNQQMETLGIKTDLEEPLLSELDKAVSLEPREAVPAAWMGRTTPYPRELSVVDFIREKTRQQPNAPAIDDGSRVISFGELDRKSDLVAGDLLKRGLQAEEPVVVMAPISFEFLAGILGVLKAGGCYFPMDPDTPAKRREFLLADCRTRFICANSTGRERLKGWHGAVIDLSQTLNDSTGRPEKIPVVPSDPNRAAYLLYTSGSTGQPKGVQIEHHSLTNFVCFYHRHFHLTPADRSSLLAYLAFDVSVSDIWPVLCAGGTVVVPPQKILNDPDGLIQWLEARKITISFVPTGLVEILFTRPWPEAMKLRYLITGGDRLRVRPPSSLPFTVINGYGPTESTVFATMSVVKPMDEDAKAPAIGRPLDNVIAYVLDENLQLLPVGAAGELYLGGVQLARGYLGRPELTRDCFVPDPFSSRPGARMYRTGDWARWLPDGELDFLGRKDDQIQIRGFRVELGEIESALFAHQAVKQVCCVPRLIDGMPTGVIAHVVANNHHENLTGELRDYLSSELPEQMVPSQFVLHERLPLTPQGKVDRTALKTALPENKEAPPSIGVKDGLEKALAGLWQSLFPEATNARAEATFAELGGDSLSVVKLLLGVQEITGQPLETSAFLMQPTFAGLCQAVKAQMARGEFQPVLTLRKHGNRPPLFLLYGLSGDIEIYLGLVEALGDDQPVYGIRSPALDNLSHLPASIEDAAADIVRCIRKIQPEGAPALVGYCWAGQLAFAVSRQLVQTEGVNCYAAAIGTDAPRRPTTTAFRTTHFIRHFPNWLWTLFWDENRGRRIKNLWGGAATKNNHSQEKEVITPEWYSSPIARHLMTLTQKYCPLPRTDSVINVFREREEYRSQAHPARPWDTSYLPEGGWDRWTSGARIQWLDGNHNSILRPPLVASLARAIRSEHDRHLRDTNAG